MVMINGVEYNTPTTGYSQLYSPFQTTNPGVPGLGQPYYNPFQIQNAPTLVAGPESDIPECPDGYIYDAETEMCAPIEAAVEAVARSDGDNINRFPDLAVDATSPAATDNQRRAAVAIGRKRDEERWDKDRYATELKARNDEREKAFLHDNITTDGHILNPFEANRNYNNVAPMTPDKGGLISGVGADGIGDLGALGDLVGGISDRYGLTDYKGEAARVKKLREEETASQAAAYKAAMENRTGQTVPQAQAEAAVASSVEEVVNRSIASKAGQDSLVASDGVAKRISDEDLAFAQALPGVNSNTTTNASKASSTKAGGYNPDTDGNFRTKSDVFYGDPSNVDSYKGNTKELGTIGRISPSGQDAGEGYEWKPMQNANGDVVKDSVGGVVFTRTFKDTPIYTDKAISGGGVDGKGSWGRLGDFFGSFTDPGVREAWQERLNKANTMNEKRRVYEQAQREAAAGNINRSSSDNSSGSSNNSTAEETVMSSSAGNNQDNDNHTRRANESFNDFVDRSGEASAEAAGSVKQEDGSYDISAWYPNNGGLISYKAEGGVIPGSVPPLPPEGQAPMSQGQPPMDPSMMQQPQGMPMAPPGAPMAAPMAPPAPVRMSFADKVAAAREAIKAGAMTVPTSMPSAPTHTMPDGSMMPGAMHTGEMMMDGQGNGPVEILGNAGTTTPGMVGPDIGPDTVDSELEEGSFVMNPEASEMYGDEIRAMMNGGYV